MSASALWSVGVVHAIPRLAVHQSMKEMWARVQEIRVALQALIRTQHSNFSKKEKGVRALDGREDVCAVIWKLLP